MAAGKEVKNLKSKLDGDELDLSMSELSVVPVREIAALKKVTKLDLSANRISILDDEFCTLKNLVKLDLSSNKLRSLPEQFGKLENLQHLDLYKNHLETLPASFGYLKNLRWLDLKDNPLEGSLLKVAGDCLDPKQCKEAATKVVQHMQKINADKERERQKELKKQRDHEAAEKAKEDEVKNTKAAEKKKEKDRKKESKQHRDNGEKHQEHAKESKKEEMKRAAAHRERDNTKQEKRAKKGKGRGFFGCISCLFCSIFGLILFAAFLCAIFAFTLYANCSRPSGSEFIPKTRELCQDVYQMIQTGKITPPQTWDYKATIDASGSALRNASNDVVESIRQFDYIGWKNAIIAFTLTCRDTIVRLAIWTYENGTEIGKPIMKKFGEWLFIVFSVGIWCAERAVHYAIQIGQWTIDTTMDVVNNFPAYWEKVKLYWNNLK